MENNVVSQWVKNKFTADGYIYVFDKMSKDNVTKFWRCEQKGRCKARLHTKGKEVIKKVNNHSHDTSAAKIEKDKVITAIKRRAEDTVENTIQYYYVLQVNAARAAPANLKDLIIPELYAVYEPQPDRQENFLLADSGPGQNRIIIFGRRRALDILQESGQWYADGTFTLAPPLFSQIYVILAEKFGGVHPVLYALLPNKQQLRPNLNPRAMACDYEAAAFQAMTDSFPGVRIHGCFFHLVKNMKKHIGQLQLSNMYNNNPDFSLKARMITALAFVPIPDLDQAIDVLADELPAELEPLLEWRLLLFPVDMWNLHERTLNGEDRTNNHAEASHRRLQTELTMDHPTIWKLIEGLKKVQKGRDVFYERLVAGNSPPKNIKKYRDVDERILRLVRDYEDRDIIEFLRVIAHNYQMQQLSLFFGFTL
ncbi:hypothetical protein RN001_012453 [Aquatica leii]|uniref:FLYWCH-type domain-containing protein n=1 Tax=Aquatica leii TaxID=1421715 RepID=A0AAN7S7S5_9COLE|nr:hypothetical protein RN001_012453 [Aquatica leii]